MFCGGLIYPLSSNFQNFNFLFRRYLLLANCALSIIVLEQNASGVLDKRAYSLLTIPITSASLDSRAKFLSFFRNRHILVEIHSV